MKKSSLFISIMLAIASVVLLSGSAFSEEKAKKEVLPLFTISQITVAEDIKEREPIGIADNFPSDIERVYVFIEAAEITEDTDLTVNWYNEGEKVHSYTLPLRKGLRWRTYAYKNIYGREGNWEIKLTDENGNEVDSVTFTVQ